MPIRGRCHPDQNRSSPRHLLPMIPSHCRNCWRNLQWKIQGGREKGRVKAIFSQRLPPNRARNSVHQATCRAKKAIAEKVLGHSYLVPKNTGAQLFRAKNTGAQLFKGKTILGHSYLEAKNTGAQLFRAKNTGAQLFRGKTILGHSYFEQKILYRAKLYSAQKNNTGAQLFRAKKYWCTAI